MAKIIKNEFSCYRDNLRIRGTVFMPDAGQNLPIAVVCHEFMANSFSTKRYAKTLAECGYAAYCFDFCGGATFGFSQGDTRNMSVLTEIEDLNAVAAFAKGQPYTDPDRMLLMGCSQGGLVAAIAAARSPESVAGLILFYPAFIIPEHARRGHMLGMKFDPANIPDELRMGPIRLGKRYVTDVIDMDVLPIITGYTGKVLIVHGDRDEVVEISSSQSAYEAYKAAGADVTLKILPGARHVFHSIRDVDLAKQYIKEFAQTL